MAGLWDITVGGFHNRINVKLLRCELIGVAMGVQTRANAKSNIESQLGRVLDAAESSDLTAVADNFETGTVQDRLVYNSVVDMTLNAAELNLINEAQFRSLLGIS